jgi:hypothetical protein
MRIAGRWRITKAELWDCDAGRRRRQQPHAQDSSGLAGLAASPGVTRSQGMDRPVSDRETEPGATPMSGGPEGSLGHDGRSPLRT